MLRDFCWPVSISPYTYHNLTSRPACKSACFLSLTAIIIITMQKISMYAAYCHYLITYINAMLVSNVILVYSFVTMWSRNDDMKLATLTNRPSKARPISSLPYAEPATAWFGRCPNESPDVSLKSNINAKPRIMKFTCNANIIDEMRQLSTSNQER
jgi:hypothetical protein